MNENMKHNWGDPLPLPFEVVRKPLSENLEFIKEDVNDCIVHIEGVEPIPITLKYKNEVEGYVIEGLSEFLQGKEFYKGKITNEEKIHPIEIEFYLDENKKLKDPLEDAPELPANYLKLLEDKKDNEV